MKADLNDLASFAVVAEERSFTRAAARLGVSQSALSHSMRNLELRIGIQLLARTTRSVSPTAAGQELLAELSPSLERIDGLLAKLRNLRDRPTGRVRLVLPRNAARLILMPKLAAFLSTYPDVVLEVTTSNEPIDLVAGKFDAGIQIGEFIHRDMVAVRVTKDVRLVAFASPKYFQKHKPPQTPSDLRDHPCIGFRFRSGLYRWEFAKGRRHVTVSPEGPLSFDDPSFVIDAALDGLGIGLALEDSVTSLVEQGRLRVVLSDWCPEFPGYFLYYPSRRNLSAALSALVKTFRLDGEKGGIHECHCLSI